MEWEQITRVLAENPEALALAGLGGGASIAYSTGKYVARSEAAVSTTKDLEEKLEQPVLDGGLMEKVLAAYRYGKKKGFEEEYEERLGTSKSYVQG